MASEGGGKIKTKRSGSSSKPYERRKTLLGKVKETVRDLLAPSWLTDFMSSVSKKSNLNEPEEPTETTALIENEDDAQDVYMPVGQSNSIPPSLSTPASRLHVQASKATNRSAAVPSGSPQVQFSQLTSGGHRDPTLHGGMSERATSRPEIGLTSELPHAERNHPAISRVNEPEMQKLKDNVNLPAGSFGMQSSTPATATRSGIPVAERRLPSSSVETEPAAVSSALKRRHVKTGGVSDPPVIWSTQSQRQGKHLAPAVRDRPTFNASLFGSPLSTSILGETIHESSFYSGKTTYGGASAYRRPRLNVTDPYQNVLPIRKSVKPKIHNSSFTSGAITSSTSQRILETLERMSTPLSDAKKIPSNQSSMVDSVLSFTPSSYRRQSRRAVQHASSLPYRPLEMPSRAPPTHQLQTPFIASIARNRQPLASTSTISRIPQVEEVPSEEMKSQQTQKQKPEMTISRTDTVSLDELPGSGGFSGKMKRNKSYSQHVSKRQDEDEEIMEVPNLQTDITLKVGSMPKFEFGSSSSPAVKSSSVTCLSTQASAPLKPSVTPPVKSISHGTEGHNSSTAAESHNKLKFTFSTPIAKPCPQPSVDNSPPKLGFKFSSPIRIDDKKLQETGKDEKMCTTQMFLSEKSAFGTSAKRKSTIGNGGFGIATELKEGSVMDILSKTNLPATSVFKSVNELKNDNIVDHSPVLGTKSAEKSKSDKNDGVSGMFKPAATLKTGSVMDILGKPSDGDKKAEQRKEGSVMDAMSKDNKGTDNLLAKFKNPPGSWECDTCMVQNKPEVDKCVACQSHRKTKGHLTNSLPKDDLLTKFAKPAGAWECDVCMVQNKADSNQCVACTAAKPGGFGSKSSGQSFGTLFKKATGSWDCDTCLVQNKAESSKCVACGIPRPSSQPAGAVSSATSSKTGSSIGSISKTGGFQIVCENAIPSSILKSDTSSQPTGGFKFGETGKSDMKASESSVVGSSNTGTISGGFKFENANNILKKPIPETGLQSSEFSFGGSGNKTPAGEVKQSGFNFGATDKKTSSTSGLVTTSVGETKFSFGSAISQTSKESEVKQGGFTFGSGITQTSKEDVKGGSLSFGIPVSQTKKDTTLLSGSTGLGTPVDNTKEPTKSSSLTIQGGFSFGSKTNFANDSITKASTSETSISGGFSFGSTAQPAANNSGLNSDSAGSVSSVKNTLTSDKSSTSAQEKKTENVNTSLNFNFVADANKAGATGQVNSSPFTFGQPATNFSAVPSKPMFGATQSVDKVEMAKPNASLFTFGQPAAAKIDNSVGQNAASVSGTLFGGDHGSAKRRTEDSGETEAKKKPFSFGLVTDPKVFNFGGPASTNGPSTTFVFGAASNETKVEKPAASGGSAFGSFGQHSSTFVPTTTISGASLFKFGSTQNSTPFGNTGSVPAFGNGPTGPGTLAFGASVPQAASTPSFGTASNAAPTASGGVFGSAVPAFGSASATTPSTFVAPSQSTQFAATPTVFGGSSTQQNTTGFKFNSNTNFGGNTSGPLFQFSGTNQTESAAGAPAQGSVTSGFSFTSQPQTASPAPSFNTPQPLTGTSTGVFNIGERKIKKAVRKLKK